jgi:hypothetical protein
MAARTGFGLRDVAIALLPSGPGTTPTWVDIPSVESAAFELAVGEEKQYGDDKYQGTFYHTQEGTISVETNKLDLDVFEMLSGNTVSVDSGADSLYFGTESELLPPQVMVRALIPYRNDDGTTGVMRVYWFKADVTTLWSNVPGSTRAEIMSMELNFNVYPSATNEKGDPIPASAGGHAFGRFSLVDDA